jgi:hypothetical protein
MALASL